jgi:hypothetical protein
MITRPCEHGCRRSVHDDAVAIADLVTYAIDTELAAGEARLPLAVAHDRRSQCVAGSLTVNESGDPYASQIRTARTMNPATGFGRSPICANLLMSS